MTLTFPSSYAVNYANINVAEKVWAVTQPAAFCVVAARIGYTAWRIVKYIFDAERRR